MNNWLNPQIVEQARERQTLLLQVAARHRLLQQLPQPTVRWALLRTFALYSGNLLIAAGLWLKHRAAPAQNHRHLPTVAGRFS